jgi:hypothetical protein
LFIKLKNLEKKELEIPVNRDKDKEYKYNGSSTTAPRRPRAKLKPYTNYTVAEL